MKIGKIKIAKDLYDNHWQHVVIGILKLVKITSFEPSKDILGDWIITGTSDFFLDIEKGAVIPTYCVDVELSGNKTITRFSYKDYLQSMISFNSARNKPQHAYSGTHIPSGERWRILGINKKENKVCVAGYPPCEAKLSDMENISEIQELSEPEFKYREKHFGNNWD